MCSSAPDSGPASLGIRVRTWGVRWRGQGSRAPARLGQLQEPPLCPQVSHHPPVSAFHVSNRKDGFCISGSVTAKSRFYGESSRRAWGWGRTGLPVPWPPGLHMAAATCISHLLLRDHTGGECSEPASGRAPPPHTHRVALRGTRKKLVESAVQSWAVQSAPLAARAI